MNQQLLQGLTATLLITAISAAASTYAEQVIIGNRGPETNSSPSESAAPAGTGSSQNSPTSPTVATSKAPTPEAMKVGTYRSGATTESEAIAKVHPHQIGNRSAATLYVRNIPVLTFLGTSVSSPDSTRTGAEAVGQGASSSSGSSTIKVGALQEISKTASDIKAFSETDTYQKDPVWRATSIAATLNQLSRDSLDASKIRVLWDTKHSLYVITLDGKQLVSLDTDTKLPDTTKDAAKDALQATNRLRRLLGDADPLTAIEGQPKPTPVRSLQAVQYVFNGWASWYGPGFNGNLSASGEVFNQHDLTAAHRYLPFGTRVRVTNLDNGRSVVVRINDRGPYIHDRVIDLSLGAAQVIGMLGSGVAPVKVDVLTPSRAATGRR
ncbi:MAG: septal ring lytic transglycosylase RlpA family protein [Leptolyngbyaceae cyanobacterium bins.59]|nr:septal ring lytic transglycosylase RlpA family protein [Leptolyngbyaceae cyanobacterium bins.59]